VTEPTQNPRRARQAARSAGERRVQNVTLWTAAGSVVAATVLSVVLAQGTSAAAAGTSTTTNTGSNTNSGTGSGTSGGTDSSGSDQLQAPQYLPGSSSGDSTHGSSGAS
jgi:hypothetical protein